MPAPMRKSMTYDRGKEMSAHAQLTARTGVAVYFADPHSPWQRGSNENTNGLLRQYRPRARTCPSTARLIWRPSPTSSTRAAQGLLAFARRWNADLLLRPTNADSAAPAAVARTFETLPIRRAACRGRCAVLCTLRNQF